MPCARVSFFFARAGIVSRAMTSSITGISTTVELAAMLRQMPDATKLSLRSGRLYDSGAICKALGGGGHFSAAGASLHPDPEKAERQLLEAVYALYPELRQ